MENIINNFKNLPSWARIIIISVAVCFALKVGVLSLVPGFVWAGVVIGGLVIAGKAAYSAYIRINNLPNEAADWVDGRINNIFDNVKDDDGWKW